MPKNRWLKLIIASLWLTGLVTAAFVWRRMDVPISELPEAMARWLDEFGTFNAAAIFLLLYTLRPIIFFPSVLFALASGLVFGPWIGITLTMLGENLGANLAFWLTRLLGRQWVEEHEKGFVQKLDHRIGSNGLLSVAIFRLVSLPYDTVSYSCGLTSVSARHYMLGTFLGSIPYLASIAMMGGAASEQGQTTLAFLGFEVSLSVLLVWTSMTLLIGGVLVAYKLRRSVFATEMKP